MVEVGGFKNRMKAEADARMDAAGAKTIDTSRYARDSGITQLHILLSVSSLHSLHQSYMEFGSDVLMCKEDNISLPLGI